MKSETPLKQWIIEEAIRLNITTRAFESRFYRGSVPKPFTVRRGKREIYVVNVDESLVVGSTC